MSKENRNYELRSSTRPKKSGALLNTVQVRNELREVGYVYIRFSDKLIEAVGKKLPRGISEADPAYLSVVFSDMAWHIWAGYVSESGGSHTLMWKQSTKPSWLKFHPLKKAKDANDLEAQALPRDTSSTGRSSPTQGDTDSSL